MGWDGVPQAAVPPRVVSVRRQRFRTVKYED